MQKIDDSLVSSIALLKELLKKAPEIKEYKTKIPSLDRFIGGFQEGELTVVSGLTGQGKTLFCQTLTRNFERQNIHCLWFSYEMTARNFLLSFGSPLCFFYLPRYMQEHSINWIEKKIQEGVSLYGVKCVFIDHLHYIVDMQRRNISVDIGIILRSLKKITLKYEICMFLIAHTLKTQPEHELDTGDIRDSSFVEQEADNVFYIWRTKQENESILKITKNRRYGIIQKKIKLVKINSFLEEKNDV